MPKYDFKCNNCNKDFSVVLGINENKENIECTECKSENTSRIYNFKILKRKYKEVEENEKIITNKNVHQHDHSQCSPELDYM